MDVLDSSRINPRHLTFAGTPKSFIRGETEQGWESGMFKRDPQQLISTELLCLILSLQLKRRKSRGLVSEPSGLVGVLLIAAPKYSPRLMCAQLGHFSVPFPSGARRRSCAGRTQELLHFNTVQHMGIFRQCGTARSPWKVSLPNTAFTIPSKS